MADYITKIRTEAGDLPISFDHLWNKPTPVTPSSVAKTGQFADAKAVYDQIKDVKDIINDIQSGDALAGITINGKDVSDSPTLTAADVGAAAATHEHDASDITSGALSMDRGGTGAENGKDGLKNLLAAGHMILSEYQYGNSTPPIPETSAEREAMTGRIFFVKAQS